MLVKQNQGASLGFLVFFSSVSTWFEEHGQIGLYNVCSKAGLQPRHGFMDKSKSSETCLKQRYIFLSLDLPFPCDICERSFNSKRGLNQHARTQN